LPPAPASDWGSVLVGLVGFAGFGLDEDSPFALALVLGLPADGVAGFLLLSPPVGSVGEDIVGCRMM